MSLIRVRVDVEDEELLDAAADVQALLDLDARVVDLSPSCRRVLVELDQACTDAYLRARAASRRAGRLRREAEALHAQARQVVAKSRETLRGASRGHA